MPELPEVEAIANFLAEHAVGRVVGRTDVVAVNVLKTYEPPVSALGGLRVTGVSRHGKFLDLDVSGLHLIVHLARAGWLRWRDEMPAKPPRPGKGPLAMRVKLAEPDMTDTSTTACGFDITEAGTQKRLAVHIVHHSADVAGLRRLGVDPLDAAFTAETFGRLLSGRRNQLKGVLTDQTLIAGLGNAYSDEVLHAAGLSPFKPASNLSDEEVETLHAAIVNTLREAVERSAGLATGSLKATKRSGLRIHGRTGEPCPVCSDTIREISFSESALQYCPTCQTGGKLLADRRLSRLLK